MKAKQIGSYPHHQKIKVFYEAEDCTNLHHRKIERFYEAGDCTNPHHTK